MAGGSIRRVATIGTGTIGASWTAVFLARGLTVSASDPAPGAETFLREFVAKAWPSLARLSPLPAEPPWTALSFHTQPEAAVAGAEFIQESAPEREELKRALLARLDAVLDPEIVIASSSSGLLMSRVQIDCRHPERCVVGHPFNPPHLVPLVEVVGGEKTGPEAIERALAFYTAIGKQPIHIRREVPGHVANRLQAALWRDGASLGLDGATSDLSPCRRGRRYRSLPRPIRRADGGLVGDLGQADADFRAARASRRGHCRRNCRTQYRRVGKPGATYSSSICWH